MVHALRQHVVVEPDGRIILHVPELKPGTHAEVIVVEKAESELDDVDENSPLSNLIGSCQGMFATPEEADAHLTTEREAWDG